MAVPGWATGALLNPFLDGMEEAGAEVSRYDTSAMSILPCEGCFACSINQTGVCWQQDDLTKIYQDVVDADGWVFATPIYVSGPTGPLKTLIDRLLIPLGEPRLSLLDGHCHHAMRPDVKRGKIILVSTPRRLPPCLGRLRMPMMSSRLRKRQAGNSHKVNRYRKPSWHESASLCCLLRRTLVEHTQSALFPRLIRPIS